MSSDIFQRFGPSFEMQVPSWSRSEMVKKLTAIGVHSTDEVADAIKKHKYKDPVHMLKPKSKIKMRVIHVAKGLTVSMDTCIEYLQSEDALLPGIDGLMLAYLLAPELFKQVPLPEGIKHLRSFKSPTLKERAFRDEKGQLRSPYISMRNGKPQCLGHAVYRVVGATSPLIMFRLVP